MRDPDFLRPTASPCNRRTVTGRYQLSEPRSITPCSGAPEYDS